MTTSLPPPPVPADADLTDFKFMPLEVARLRRSRAWLICKRRPELAFFMLNLWSASWHERPAGSLEDDDDVLADAAMCSPERWPKVRAEVLRGWFKASDGRLYHPVVAEKVADSWHGKAVARWVKECDRIRKENHRREKKSLPPMDLPPKPERKDPVFPAEVGGIPPENALKGEGRDREGKGEEEEDSAAAAAGPAPNAPTGGPRDAATIRALVDEAHRLWMPVAYELRIPEPGFLNPDRRELLAARLAECGWLDGWATALANLREAKFLRDEADPTKPKPWVNLGALLKPETFTGLMEGRYAERHDPSKRNGHQGPARSSAIRTATNFAAALGGLGAGGPGGPRRRADGDGMEAADAFDHARAPGDGE